MNLEQLYEKALKINLKAIEQKVIKQTEAEIIDLNTNQLQKGLDANGNKLPEYQNENYLASKKAQGLATAGSNYNFYLEGDFYKGFFMDDKGDINSSDEKTPKLEKLAGEPIFGLTNESIKNYEKDVFLEMFLEDLTNELGL